jgi:hypothetical protein
MLQCATCGASTSLEQVLPASQPQTALAAGWIARDGQPVRCDHCQANPAAAVRYPFGAHVTFNPRDRLERQNIPPDLVHQLFPCQNYKTPEGQEIYPWRAWLTHHQTQPWTLAQPPQVGIVVGEAFLQDGYIQPDSSVDDPSVFVPTRRRRAYRIATPPLKARDVWIWPEHLTIREAEP